jgi:hypothetical protein
MTIEEELEFYKGMCKTILELNKSCAEQLRDISETIFIHSNNRKKIFNLRFELLQISRKLTTYTFNEKEEE